VTAIKICSISSSRDGSGEIRAAVFPRPSLFGALLGGAQFGRGRECWERPKETLFVVLLGEPRRSRSPPARTVGSLFSAKSIGAGPAPKWLEEHNADGGLQWASLEKERQVI
jgi:hypothetical protein